MGKKLPKRQRIADVSEHRRALMLKLGLVGYATILNEQLGDDVLVRRAGVGVDYVLGDLRPHSSRRHAAYSFDDL